PSARVAGLAARRSLGQRAGDRHPPAVPEVGVQAQPIPLLGLPAIARIDLREWPGGPGPPGHEPHVFLGPAPQAIAPGGASRRVPVVVVRPPGHGVVAPDPALARPGPVPTELDVAGPGEPEPVGKVLRVDPFVGTVDHGGPRRPMAIRHPGAEVARADGHREEGAGQRANPRPYAWAARWICPIERNPLPNSDAPQCP